MVLSVSSKKFEIRESCRDPRFQVNPYTSITTPTLGESDSLLGKLSKNLLRRDSESDLDEILTVINQSYNEIQEKLLECNRKKIELIEIIDLFLNENKPFQNHFNIQDPEAVKKAKREEFQFYLKLVRDCVKVDNFYLLYKWGVVFPYGEQSKRKNHNRAHPARTLEGNIQLFRDCLSDPRKFFTTTPDFRVFTYIAYLVDELNHL